MLTKDQLRQQLLVSFRDLVDIDVLVQASVLLIGAGGVGSLTALLLALSGVGTLGIWDLDTISIGNMARSIYRVQDWDRLKVQALKQHLKSINPFIKVVAFAGDILKAPAAVIASLGQRYGLVIVAVDDIRVHESLNSMFYPRTEAVYTYVTDNGNAGEIVRTRPGEPGCVRCLTNVDARRRVGTTTGFQAMGLDFHRVAMEAACVTLGILLRGKRGGELFREYVAPSAHLFMVLTRRHGALAEALPEGFLNGTVAVDTRSAGLRCPVCGG